MKLFNHRIISYLLKKTWIKCLYLFFLPLRAFQIQFFSSYIFSPFFKLWSISLFLLLLCNTSALSQKEQLKQDIPKRLERKFKRDAARLALRLNAEKEDLRYLGVSIAPSDVFMIYDMLVNLYHQEETMKSIVKCNVHTFPSPAIDQLVLVYERAVDWADPLRNGISETDNPIINELLEDYELIIEKHVIWDDQMDAITIRSKEPLNMAALANEFSNIKGIQSIDLGVPKVIGNDITLARLADAWEIKFILRFGSYLKEGGNEHSWTFHCMDDATMQLVEEEGAPIPSWMRCEKQDMLFEDSKE